MPVFDLSWNCEAMFSVLRMDPIVVDCERQVWPASRGLSILEVPQQPDDACSSRVHTWCAGKMYRICFAYNFPVFHIECHSLHHKTVSHIIYWHCNWALSHFHSSICGTYTKCLHIHEMSPDITRSLAFEAMSRAAGRIAPIAAQAACFNFTTFVLSGVQYLFKQHIDAGQTGPLRGIWCLRWPDPLCALDKLPAADAHPGKDDTWLSNVSLFFQPVLAVADKERPWHIACTVRQNQWGMAKWGWHWRFG